MHSVVTVLLSLNKGSEEQPKQLGVLLYLHALSPCKCPTSWLGRGQTFPSLYPAG